MNVSTAWPLVSDDPQATSQIITAGIIGAGQMGNGIAHVCAQAGIQVVLLDVDQSQLDSAVATISRNLDRQVKRGTLTAGAKDEALALITATTDYAAFADADIVIEAATEREDVKRAIFAMLLPHIKPSCIIASNTSSISITRLAAATDRPDRFIGMHFMNPVPVMKLVEIIRGVATGDAAFEAAMALAERLRKTTAVAEDLPAFILNRVLVTMLNEAVFALQEGVGNVASIDAALRLGANHPMGPLELADFIGLDTCLAVMQVIQEGMSDCKYRPCPLLVKYVEAGWLGRKSGRGFYDYTVTPPRPTR
jgi:3-hydroxybutyryl-CoA dehydrogenase